MGGWQLPKADRKLGGLDTFAPHSDSVFEGYYFRVDLPSGAVVAVILFSSSPKKAAIAKKQLTNRIIAYVRGDRHDGCECKVDGGGGGDRPAEGLGEPDNHRLLFTYFPGPRHAVAPTHIMLTPAEMVMTKANSDDDLAAGAFSVKIPGIGEMSVGPRPHSPIKLELSTPEFEIAFETRSRISWNGKLYPAEDDVGDQTAAQPTAQADDETGESGMFGRLTREFSRLWARGKDWADSPAGLIAMLPWMPLYWHVHTVASDATFRLSVPRMYIPIEDRNGTNAVVHAQCNWGAAFPSQYIWMHGYKKEARDRSVNEDDDGDRSDDQWFMCAGGNILHTQSILISYRGRRNTVTFRPPFGVSVREYSRVNGHKCSRLIESVGKLTQYSPLKLHTDVSWPEGRVEMEVKGLRVKMRVTATAPPQTFVGMASPVDGGVVRLNSVAESMRAEVKVEVYRRSGLGGVMGDWELDEENVFTKAALDFGSDAGLDMPVRGQSGRGAVAA